MEKTVRPAEPGDVDEIARLCYLAGKSQSPVSCYDLMFDGPFGATAERIGVMAKVLTTQLVSWLHYSHHLVVEVGGKVAATLATFTREENDPVLFGRALMELGWRVEDLEEVSKRSAVFVETSPDELADALVIENVAVFEDYRGQGLGRALLDAAIERGRAGGFPMMQLAVLLGNDPAVRLYESVGFKMEEKRLSRGFEEVFGSPGMALMVLYLVV